MNKKEIAAVVFSCTITAALLFAFDPPTKSPACIDGWDSPSIGLQGACSHHGGVTAQDQEPFYLIALSFAAGAGIFLALAKILGLFETPEENAPFLDSKSKLVFAAITSHKKISFQYQKRDAAVPERRVITPVELKLLVPRMLNTRCVVGHCSRANATRTFTLSRMSEIVLHEG